VSFVRVADALFGRRVGGRQRGARLKRAFHDQLAPYIHPGRSFAEQAEEGDLAGGQEDGHSVGEQPQHGDGLAAESEGGNSTGEQEHGHGVGEQPQHGDRRGDHEGQLLEGGSKQVVVQHPAWGHEVVLKEPAFVTEDKELCTLDDGYASRKAERSLKAQKSVNERLSTSSTVKIGGVKTSLLTVMKAAWDVDSMAITTQGLDTALQSSSTSLYSLRRRILHKLFECLQANVPPNVYPGNLQNALVRLRRIALRGGGGVEVADVPSGALPKAGMILIASFTCRHLPRP